MLQIFNHLKIILGNLNLVLSWIQIFLFFIPIWWLGFLLARRSSSTRRSELLVTIALPTGIGIYIFILNLISFLVRGTLGIYFSFLLVASLIICLSRIKTKDLNFPKIRTSLLFVLSVAVWGGFLLWKIGHAIFGGDISLYYAIAKTFARGNFPIMSPWQADLPVKYHYGASILLGAMQIFTGFEFIFLHSVLALFTILSSIIFLIWFLKRHNNIFSLAFYQIVPIVGLITVGCFFTFWPIFPIKLPAIHRINDFVIWGRALPSVHLSFETYGATITLGLFTYFIFQAVSLSIFLALLFFLIYPSHNNTKLYFITLFSLLASLALTNESTFVPALIVAFVFTFFRLIKEKKLKKTFLSAFIISILFGIIILFQGGIITDSILHEEKSSIILFPGLQNPPYDFSGYHHNQEASKLFKIKDEWKPFRWYHFGLKWYYAVIFLACLYLIRKHRDKKFATFLMFVMSGAISSFMYNNVVPRYLPANGNRLLSASYDFLGIAIAIAFVTFIEDLFQKDIKKALIILSITTIFIFIPSTVPMTLQYSLSRFGENRLLHPKKVVLHGALLWLEENTKPYERVLNLDKTPFQSMYIFFIFYF